MKKFGRNKDNNQSKKLNKKLIIVISIIVLMLLTTLGVWAATSIDPGHASGGGSGSNSYTFYYLYDSSNEAIYLYVYAKNENNTFGGHDHTWSKGDTTNIPASNPQCHSSYTLSTAVDSARADGFSFTYDDLVAQLSAKGYAMDSRSVWRVGTSNDYLTYIELTEWYSSHTCDYDTDSGEVYKNATCTSKQQNYKKCGGCGSNPKSSSYVVSVGEPLGHNYDGTELGDLVTAADCFSAATYQWGCTRCDEQDGIAHSHGSALGHKEDGGGWTYTDPMGWGWNTRADWYCTRGCGTILDTMWYINFFTTTGITSTSGSNWYHYGDTVYFSATPSYGYNFSNWGDSVTTNSRSMTCTGPWYTHAYASEWTHTVSYNANTGTGSFGNQTKTYTNTVRVHNGPSKTGYTFKYWSTTGHDPINYMAKVQTINNPYIKSIWINWVSDSVVEILVYAPGASRVQVPSWTLNNGQDELVWHELGAGSWSRGGQPFNFGSQVSITDHKGEVWDYVTHIYAYNSAGTCIDNSAFSGSWGFAYSAGEVYTGHMHGGTQTLTAQWRPNVYTIYYNANNTSLTPNNIYGDAFTTNPTGTTNATSATYDAVTKLATNGFSRPGYTFKGWSLYKDWKNGDPANRLFGSGATITNGNYTGSAYTGGFTATDGGSVTLYAIWEPIKYNVTYEGGRDTDGNNVTNGQNETSGSSQNHNSIRFDQYVTSRNSGDFKKQYTITFNPNGGYFTGISGYNASNKSTWKYDNYAKTETWTHTTWSRYQTLNSSGAAIDTGSNGGKIALNTSFRSLTTTANARVYLEAVWSHNTITLEPLKRDGYWFNGWIDGNTGGNIGGTTGANKGGTKSNHTFNATTTVTANWSGPFPLSTSKIVITDDDFVHAKDVNTNTYYVRANTGTTFKLTHNSYINNIDSSRTATAGINFQFNGVDYMASTSSGNQRVTTALANKGAVNNSTYNQSTAMSSSGTKLLNPSGNTSTSITNYLRNMNIVSNFYIDPSLNGATITVYPRVYNTLKDNKSPTNHYSTDSSDKNNAIKLIADAEAPIMTGVNEMVAILNGVKDNIDKDLGAVNIIISASDPLSGVRSLKIYVTNIDNNMSHTYVGTKQSNGSFKVSFNLAENSELFNGDTIITVEAIDNVSNVYTKTVDTTEFTLNLEVRNIRKEPVTTAFKNGDMLYIMGYVTGYADRMVLTIPAEMLGEQKDRVVTYDFVGNKPLEITEEFAIVDMEAPNKAYNIKSQAFKDKNHDGDFNDYGEVLNASVDIDVVKIQGSIVDDWKNNLE